MGPLRGCDKFKDENNQKMTEEKIKGKFHSGKERGQDSCSA